MKRGDIVTQDGVKVKVLGPEDFDGYVYNNPTNYTGKSKPWELVEYLDDVFDQHGKPVKRAWVPRYALKATDVI